MYLYWTNDRGGGQGSFGFPLYQIQSDFPLYHILRYQTTHAVQCKKFVWPLAWRSAVHSEQTRSNLLFSGRKSNEPAIFVFFSRSNLILMIWLPIFTSQSMLGSHNNFVLLLLLLSSLSTPTRPLECLFQSNIITTLLSSSPSCRLSQAFPPRPRESLFQSNTNTILLSSSSSCCLFPASPPPKNPLSQSASLSTPTPRKPSSCQGASWKAPSSTHSCSQHKLHTEEEEEMCKVVELRKSLTSIWLWELTPTFSISDPGKGIFWFSQTHI